MDPLEYLRAIRRRWAAVVAAVAVALAAAWITTSVTPVGLGPRVRTYEATAVVMNLGTSAGTGNENLDTVARLATIGEVPRRVAKAIGFEGEPVVLAARVNAIADQEAGILEVSSTSTDPEEAKTLADAFARELLGYLEERKALTFATQSEPIQEQLDELSEQIAELDLEIARAPPTIAERLSAKRSAKLFVYSSLSQQFELLRSAALTPSGLRIIQRAVPVALPETGFQPPRSQGGRLVLAGILGLFGGIVLALVLERADTRIRTKSEAERAFDLPVLAEIPPIPRRQRRTIVTAARPSSLHASAFRVLRMGTEVMSQELVTRDGGWSVKAIMVTSAVPGEGKTTVVANLAASYAEAKSDVLVVSCDLRRPAVHELFGVPSQPGLVEILRAAKGREALDGQVRATALPHVSVVPTGGLPDNPAELIGSEGMRSAISDARKRADIVILDTPAILVDSDATTLLSDVDAVVVVARAGKTTTQVAERATELLKRFGAPVVGVVLTDANTQGLRVWEHSAGELFRRLPWPGVGHNGRGRVRQRTRTGVPK